MSERREYGLTLRVVSPFMFASVANAQSGVDVAYLRGDRDQPIIPAEQVKGVLRDALETLAARTQLITASEILTLFGSPSPPSTGDGERDRPKRGLAIFSDLSAPIEEIGRRRITRIEIDDETGAVERGKLQVVELAAPLGQEVDFAGKLIVRFPEAGVAARVERALRAAIKLVPAIGAFKSAGFGEVVAEGCTIGEPAISPLGFEAVKESGRVVYDVLFDRPILVDARHLTENVFESAKIVPGAAFKGALAERLKLAGEDPEKNPDSPLARALERLRFSHAFPLVANGDNVYEEAELPIPNSIVYWDAGEEVEFGDISHAEFGAAPLARVNDGCEAADFVVTAKERVREMWRKRFDSPALDIALLPRMHVGLNNDKEGKRLALSARKRIAADEQIFSAICVPTASLRWRLVADSSGIEDKELAAKLLASLEEGLDDIGKTSATATFTRRDPEPLLQLGDKNEATILLVTPAALFFKSSASNDREGSLFDRYRSYFCVFGLELENFFASIDLAGGHAAIRRSIYGGDYYPFILTVPGAIFRLKIPDMRGRENLEKFLRFGLPVGEIEKGVRPNWVKCPFTPENGYGEIRLHDPDKSLLSTAIEFVREVGVRDV